MIKYEFDLEFELPVSYPVTPFEIVLPELDGKTSKMYRGGKICLSSHFKPLWAKNVPHFGIAQALAMGVSARRNGTTQRSATQRQSHRIASQFMRSRRNHALVAARLVRELILVSVSHCCALLRSAALRCAARSVVGRRGAASARHGHAQGSRQQEAISSTRAQPRTLRRTVISRAVSTAWTHTEAENCSTPAPQAA